MKQIIGTGGCKCGSVRYKFTSGPIENQICHCPDCRKAVGAHSVAWVYFSTEDFTITSGAPTFYQSAPHAQRGFCNKCGTSLIYRSEQFPQRIAVTLGSLDDPEAFPPEKTCWGEYRLSWASPI
mgnify:CR=1 FL=1